MRCWYTQQLCMFGLLDSKVWFSCIHDIDVFSLDALSFTKTSSGCIVSAVELPARDLDDPPMTLLLLQCSGHTSIIHELGCSRMACLPDTVLLYSLYNDCLSPQVSGPYV